jgi:FkbM family methyltransferase
MDKRSILSKLRAIFIYIYTKTVNLCLFFVNVRFIGIIYENFNIIRTNDLGVKYYIRGEMSDIRFNRAYKSEPLTEKFIKSMDASTSLFWDIGACLGTFSAYAAKDNIKVISFEPNPFNLKSLYENVLINDPVKGSLIVSIALSNKNEMISLVGNEVVGNAIPIIDSMADSYKYLIPSLNLQFSTLGLLELPTHIKIDVDGNEIPVLEALSEVLKSNQLKCLYIEIPVGDSVIEEKITKLGFYLSEKHGENHLFIRK